MCETFFSKIKRFPDRSKSSKRTVLLNYDRCRCGNKKFIRKNIILLSWRISSNLNFVNPLSRFLKHKIEEFMTKLSDFIKMFTR